MKAKPAEAAAFLDPLLAWCFTGCAFLFSHSCCDVLEEENLPFCWGNSLALLLEHIKLFRHSIDKERSGYFKFGAQPGAVYGQVGLGGRPRSSLLFCSCHGTWACYVVCCRSDSAFSAVFQSSYHEVKLLILSSVSFSYRNLKKNAYAF